MSKVNFGFSERCLNQLIEAAESSLKEINTPEAQRLIKELYDIRLPYLGHYRDQTAQNKSNADINQKRYAWITKYFPDLPTIMFPAGFNKPRNNDVSVVNNAIKQMMSTLPPESIKNTVVLAENKATPAPLKESQKPTAAIAEKVKAVKLTLEDKIVALNNVKNSHAMASHPEEQSHLDFILRETNGTANHKAQQNIVDTCFKDLGKYLQKGDAKATTNYIIKQTKILRENSLANVSKQKPVETNNTVVKITPPKQTVASTVTVNGATKKSHSQQTAPKTEISAIENATLNQISKAIMILSTYKAHLVKEQQKNPNDGDLNTKILAVENLTNQLHKSLQNGDKNKALESVTKHESDITFSRNPVLRLFGLKTAAWGTTGEKCIKNIEATLKEPVSQQIKPSFRPS